MKHSIKNKGVGLIEVLITTLVIAFGLLAVASLQGKLMSGTGSNKTRSDAMQLASQKMEQLRDQIALTGYSAITSGQETAIITGANESFFRYWQVDALPATSGTTPLNCSGAVPTAADLTGPARKVYCVKVAWPYATVPTGTFVSPGPDNEVLIQSIIAYDNVAISLSLANAAKPNLGLGLNSPSMNAGSSDDTGTVKLPTTQTAGTTITPTQAGLPAEDGMHVKVNSGGNTGTIFYSCDNTGITDATKRLIPFENNLYTRRIHLQGTGTFKESIQLFEQTGTDCFLRKVYYGGVIIPIKGRVYTNTVVGSLGLNTSESGIYCVFNSTGLSTSTSVPYACYVGGKCSSTTAGTTFTTNSDGTTSTTNTIVTQCPSTVTGVTYPTYSWVGEGGWRGKVGLLGLIVGNDSKTVCFSDSRNSHGTDNGNLDTGRQYFTRRTNGSVLDDEGINKPYLCHDFLIVDDVGSITAPPACSTNSSSAGALKLEVGTKTRPLTGSTTAAPNVLLPLDADSKTSCHIISGSAPSGVTTVTATSTNGGFECTMPTTTSYSCVGTSKVPTVSIIGKNSSGVGVAAYSTSSLSSATMNVTNANLVAVTFYGVTGNITAGTNVTFGASTGNFNPLTMLSFSDTSCRVTQPTITTYIYTCNIPANSSFTFSAAQGYLAGLTSASGTSSVAVTTSALTAGTATNITVNARTIATVNVQTQGTATVTSLAVTKTVASVTTPCSAVSANSSTCTGVAAWSGTVTATGTCNGSTITSPATTVTATDTVTTVTLPECNILPHDLTVTSPSNGTIKDDLTTPVNINCGTGGTTCAYTGTTVTLYAVPNANYIFSGWTGTGACSGTTNPCTVTLEVAKGISATFAATRTINVTVTLTDSINVTGISLSPLGSCTPSTATGNTTFVCTGASTTVNTVMTVTVDPICSGTGGGKGSKIGTTNVDASGNATITVLAATTTGTATIATSKGTAACP